MPIVTHSLIGGMSVSLGPWILFVAHDYYAKHMTDKIVASDCAAEGSYALNSLYHVRTLSWVVVTLHIFELIFRVAATFILTYLDKGEREVKEETPTIKSVRWLCSQGTQAQMHGIRSLLFLWYVFVILRVTDTYRFLNLKGTDICE